MDELEPLRKVIDGKNINTDTAHLIHCDVKAISEFINGKLCQRRIHQYLYQAKEGHYFIAFWKKPVWNEKALSFNYINDVMLIESEQAKQWINNYCPEKYQEFVASMDKVDRPASIQAVTLRMPAALRNNLELVADVSNQSLNKVCVDRIITGMAAASAASRLSAPRPHEFLMPDGKLSLDEFGAALCFTNSDDQSLASYAELLRVSFQSDFYQFMVILCRTLHKLVIVDENETHAACVAKWLAYFYRPAHDEFNE